MTLSRSVTDVKSVLRQYGRSDWVLLRATFLTQEQLEEYKKELASFSYVHKWILSARLTPRELSFYLYPSLALQLDTLTVLDLSHNRIRCGIPLFQSSIEDVTTPPPYPTVEKKAKSLNVFDPVLQLISVLQLRQNKVLKILKLVDNPLGDAGALLLLRATCESELSIGNECPPKPSVTLEVLDLSRCGLTDGSASWILPILRRAVFSQSFFLKLNFNRIGSRGHRLLAQRIPEKVSLSLCRNFPLPEGRKTK